MILKHMENTGMWLVKCYKWKYNIILYILSVYSPFYDRVGLPLYNIRIPSPFTSIMDIFFVDLKFGHICFYTLPMSFLVFCLQLYTPYISSPSAHHMSIPSQYTTSNESCDRLNSNQPSQLFICPSVFQWDTTHPSNHLHLCYFKLQPTSTSKGLVSLP